MIRRTIALLLLTLSLSLAACAAPPGGSPSDPTPTAGAPIPSPTAAPTGGGEPLPSPSPVAAEPTTSPAEEMGEVRVHEIALISSGVAPVEVEAILSGTLPDACSYIESIAQAREASRFVITIHIARHPNQRCAPQPTPFTEHAILDVTGLSAGTYEVAAHGTINSFILGSDNSGLPGAIEGRIWHDLCALAEDGTPVEPQGGCVPFGAAYAANGLMEPGEPGIRGVRVELGSGPCPSSEMASIYSETDGFFRFENLDPGTYCVLVDPTRGGNETILPPGVWTAPVGSKGAQTVTLTSAGEVQQINLGWDFQFLPAPHQSACLYRAEFLADVTLPDGARALPGSKVIKTWRVRNSGTCPWEATTQLAHAPQTGILGTLLPLGTVVAPGESAELSVEFMAPVEPGRYRGDWLIHTGDHVFGVGASGQVPLYVDFIVP